MRKSKQVIVVWTSNKALAADHGYFQADVDEGHRVSYCAVLINGLVQ